MNAPVAKLSVPLRQQAALNLGSKFEITLECALLFARKVEHPPGDTYPLKFRDLRVGLL